MPMPSRCRRRATAAPDRRPARPPRSAAAAASSAGSASPAAGSSPRSGPAAAASRARRSRRRARPASTRAAARAARAGCPATRRRSARPRARRAVRRSTEASSSRASPSPSPSSVSCGSPPELVARARRASRRPATTASACRRRATNASTCAETLSSHCASSTRQRTGRSWRRVGEERQHREADEEAVGRRAGAEAERRAERGALRRGEPLDPVEQRRAQLVQARERAAPSPIRRRPRAATPAFTGLLGDVAEERASSRCRPRRAAPALRSAPSGQLRACRSTGRTRRNGHPARSGRRVTGEDSFMATISSAVRVW